MLRHIPRPSPAFVVALVALFVALSGSAVAAGIVPLAKHARTADSATVAGNARHLGGKTAAQLASSMRGPQGAVGAQGPAGPAGPAGQVGPGGPKGDTGATGALGPKGDKGDKGDVGTGLKIVGTVAAASDLPATGTTGDGYLVAGDLYVWTGSAWTNAGPVRGPQGQIGQTGPAGVAGPPGPTGAPGTAAVSIHTQAFSGLQAQAGQSFTVACAAGQKAVSGGFDSDGDVFNFDTKPTADDSGWQIFLANGADSGSAAGTVYAVCLG